MKIFDTDLYGSKPRREVTNIEREVKEICETYQSGGHLEAVEDKLSSTAEFIGRLVSTLIDADLLKPEHVQKIFGHGYIVEGDE